MDEFDATFEREIVKQAVGKWMIDCGARMKATREQRGWSRETFAAMAGVKVPTISRVESGTLNPRDDLRWIFAEILCVGVQEIWPAPPRETIVACKTGVAA